MRKKTMLITAAAVVAIGSAAAYAMMTNDWDMWATSPDAGGTALADDGAGGEWELGGTAGQIDVAGVALEGGDWTVIGGFWQGAAGRIGGACPGDANDDGRVGFADLLAVLADWGPCPPPPLKCLSDVDNNGDVGFSDVLLILANYNCGAPSGPDGMATFDESLDLAGVTTTEWDSFVEVLEFGAVAEVDNWLCWMRRSLLSDESFLDDEECPGADPRN